MVRAGSKNNKLVQFGRIGVLAGGPSSEREISLKSGRSVYEALENAHLDVVFLDVSEDAKPDIEKSKINIAFITLHGRFGEDGTIQRILEEMKIPYTGSGPASSQLALDKIASRKTFENINIPVPKYRVIEKSLHIRLDLNFPLVIKPQLEGSSIGLSIVDGPRGLEAALEKAFRYGDKIIAEEFIKGREITVGILDEKPLPPIEVIPKGRCYDFFAKYESPDTQYLVKPKLLRAHYRKAQTLALTAHKTLECRSFSRVDMILGEDSNFYVLEVNSIPGLTERSLLPKAAEAIGIPFQVLCIKILENALRKNDG